MVIQTRAYQSGDTGQVSTNAKSKPVSILDDEEVYTHEEVFGEVVINPFSLEDALDILEISEAEFQEQLDSRGFCPKEDFDRNGKFPVGWIRALDTHKWILD